ncbi:CRISPR-associated protein Cas2 [Bacillus thuringiensis]|uniref:CRISPR-associated protein Cas2 n=1 Tax=Bacillus thuringiensis TaxID=1428 RepID=UPI0010AD78C0|nr:CRISPR-associated protein Cas2 [Bacillus thuringiensis]TKA00030.1 CRISPR-associated protein Cas2 [Bacillus thuringiensis]
MNSFLISYDLIAPSKDYEKITKKIETYPNPQRILESVWIVKSNKKAIEIIDDLKLATDSNDKLFVVELKRNAASIHLDSKTDNWLEKNL